MKSLNRPSLSRRAVLGGLSTLPILLPRALAEEPATIASAFTKAAVPITSAGPGHQRHGFRNAGARRLPPAHFGYIATGVDDDRTVIRNHEAFSHYEIRARRFNDVRKLALATSVFGVSWPSPIYLSAVSAMRAFHPDAEVGVARAARSRSTHMMLSTGASGSTEEVVAARGAPILAAALSHRRLGGRRKGSGSARKTPAAPPSCSRWIRPACAISRLSSAPRVWTAAIARPATRPSRASCGGGRRFVPGLDVSRVTRSRRLDMSVAYLERLRGIVKGRLLIKGIVTREDAVIALENGRRRHRRVQSRRTQRRDTARLGRLPAEVVAAVRGRIPVFLDGGIRRGTDVFKALALGAAGVGIGRPQAWGLAAFGQPGVEAVVDILDTELTNIMRQAGTPTVAAISRAHLV